MAHKHKRNILQAHRCPMNLTRKPIATHMDPAFFQISFLKTASFWSWPFASLVTLLANQRGSCVAWLSRWRLWKKKESVCFLSLLLVSNGCKLKTAVANSSQKNDRNTQHDSESTTSLCHQLFPPRWTEIRDLQWWVCSCSERSIGCRLLLYQYSFFFFFFFFFFCGLVGWFLLLAEQTQVYFICSKVSVAGKCLLGVVDWIFSLLASTALVHSHFSTVICTYAYSHWQPFVHVFVHWRNNCNHVGHFWNPNDVRSLVVYAYKWLFLWRIDPNQLADPSSVNKQKQMEWPSQLEKVV